MELKNLNDTVPFTLNGLRVDSEVELRAVLLDERMSGRQSTPPVRVQTSKVTLESKSCKTEE